ncbi:MAG: leucine-rich repeat domain-containing protein [Alphaproteobacteria bacterium]|nr:leucine-rich repeat domain-containing protein [Alphaproteobacteria bacterium]
MRKWILVSLSMLISFTAQATDAGFTTCPQDANGHTPNCQYKIENGTLTIKAESGNNGNIGYWLDGNGNSLSPFAYLNVKHVTIENSISDLGSQAFTGLKSSAPISIPSSISELGYYSFHGVQTPEIVIPNSVQTIGTDAFSWSSINKIEIPDSVTSIHSWAFRGSSYLTDLIIPDSVANIGYTALSALPNLKTLTIGENTTLAAIFTEPSTQQISISADLKIYCTGDTAKCDANLEAAGYPQLKSQKSTIKSLNGKTYILDKNGNVIASKGTRQNKRIYTIEEAQMVSKENGNIFKLRYK